MHKNVMDVLCAVALLGCAYGLLMIAKEFSKFSYTPGIGDLATWFGAIGTIGTLIGTIVLATIETRKRKRDEELRAYLVAAGMRQRIAFALGVVTGIKNKLGATVLVDQPPEVLATFGDMLEQLETWTQESLLPLVGMPNFIAINLAQAADEIAAVGKSLVVSSKHSEIGRAENRRSLAAQMHNMLLQTVAKLDTALIESDKAIELIKRINKS